MKDRFDQLAAKSAIGTLSPEESAELDSLLKKRPAWRRELDDLRNLDAVMEDFGPLLDAAEDPPPASFPEHRMRQLRTAVWEEFRPRVTRRGPLVWVRWFQRQFLPVSVAVGGGVAASVILSNPGLLHSLQEMDQASERKAPSQLSRAAVPSPTGRSSEVSQDGPIDERTIEFGYLQLSFPEVEETAGPGEFYGLGLGLNPAIDEVLQDYEHGMEGRISPYADLEVAPVFIRRLPFESAEAFDQWKAGDLESSVFARIWIEQDDHELHVISRRGGSSSRFVTEMPQDRRQVERLMRYTLDSLTISGPADLAISK